MARYMRLRVWDVAHGAFAMLQHAAPHPLGGEKPRAPLTRIAIPAAAIDSAQMNRQWA
jgi:hypothetical protein